MEGSLRQPQALPQVHTSSSSRAVSSSSLRPRSALDSTSNVSSRSSSPHLYSSSPSTLATSPFREADQNGLDIPGANAYRLQGGPNRSTPSLALPPSTQDGPTEARKLKHRSSFFGLIPRRSSKAGLDISWKGEEHRNPFATEGDQQERSPSGVQWRTSGEPRPLTAPSLVEERKQMSGDPVTNGIETRPSAIAQRQDITDGVIPSPHMKNSNATSVPTSQGSEGMPAQSTRTLSPFQVPFTSSQVSLRDIRRAATSKLAASQEAPPRRLSMLNRPFGSSPSSPNASRRPSLKSSTPLSPRSPVMSRMDSGEEELHSCEEAGLDGDRGSTDRRLTMMDFLSAETDALAVPPLESMPSTSLSAPLTSSRSANWPTLRTAPITDQHRPRSLVVDHLPQSDHLPGHGLASTSNVSIPTISALPRRPDTFRQKIPLHIDTTTPFAARVNQEIVGSRAVDKQVTMSIKPITNVMTMFGSTQTSANYSLSGSLEIALPRPHKRKMDLRQEVGNTSAAGSEYTTPLSNDSIQKFADNPAQSTPSDDPLHDIEAPATVRSLSIFFNGYSTYADHSGRYSGIRLCEVKQDLLATGATLPLQADLQNSNHRHCDEQPSTDDMLKYEIQFDLSIPGWLPGSVYSRFGATFFCLSATAIVVNGSGQISRVHSSGSNGSTSPEHRFASPEGMYDNNQDHTYLNSSSLSGLADSSTQARLGHGRPLVPTVSTTRADEPIQTTMKETGQRSQRPPKPKSKSSWLSQKAKTLSLKSRAGASASTSAASGGSSTGGARIDYNPSSSSVALRFLDKPGRRRLPDGSFEIKSKKQLIIIRRCRDIVPVPIARLAILGDNVPAEAQDPLQLPLSEPTTTSGTDSTGTQIVPPLIEETVSSDTTTAPTSEITRVETTIAGNDIQSSDGPDVAMTENVTAAVSTDVPLNSDDTSSPPEELTVQPAPLRSTPLPSGPSTLNAPFDPTKMAAMAQRPPTPARTSSAVGAQDQALPGTSTSSSTEAGVPMRHFLHRPLLLPPADSGIPEGMGLPFSLTISVPSHIQVQTADVLTFGVQLEVGRTPGWARVRELGGLRLREMELQCLQTERHTSVPSRTFCSTFPVPAEPKIAALDLPLLPDHTPAIPKRRVTELQELRLRGGFDPIPIHRHISMAESGQPPLAENNDVERVRAGVVGPPPSFKANKHRERIRGVNRSSIQNGDEGGSESQRRSEGTTSGGPVSSGHTSRQRADGTSPGSQNVSGSSPTPVPTLQSHSLGSAGQRSTLSTALQSGRSAPIPAMHGVPNTATRVIRSPAAAGDGSSPANHTVPNGAHPTAESDGTNPGGRRGGRGRRAYEATMRGLSAFATAMLDAGVEEGGPPTPYGPFGGPPDVFASDHQPRASYSFHGDDSHGVDLTKGRVRMTVNLPLVSSSYQDSRRDGTPHLMPDYESPHMRVRHKLKVKLGFGFGPKGLLEHAEWGHSLVMCVPVRFTEAPPQEVSDQFAPMPITMTSAGEANAGMLQPIISIANSQSVPVLPAYTQLFRDDGSRLNEAEDLPAYPGPRRAVNAAIDASGMGSDNITMRPTFSSNGSNATSPSRIRRPSISTRGSVTGRLLPRSSSNNNLQGIHTDESSGGNGTQNLHGLSLDNSLAPEQVVDDALQHITDPDESRAELREQEREMAELEREATLLVTVRDCTPSLLVGEDGDGNDRRGNDEAEAGESPSDSALSCSSTTSSSSSSSSSSSRCSARRSVDDEAPDDSPEMEAEGSGVDFASAPDHNEDEDEDEDGDEEGSRDGEDQSPEWQESRDDV